MHSPVGELAGPTHGGHELLADAAEAGAHFIRSCPNVTLPARGKQTNPPIAAAAERPAAIRPFAGMNTKMSE
jgi:hypothetical protein